MKMVQCSPGKQAQFIQLCRERLQQSNALNRIIALEMFGLLSERVPIQVFLPALNDSNAEVILAALEQLRKCGKQGHVFSIELLTHLLNDADARVRRASLFTIDTQKDNVPLDLLIAALHDADEGVVQAATSILGRRRDMRAIPALLEQLLSNPRDFLMDYTDSVIAMLCECYEHVPLEPLLHALSHGTRERRLIAIKLLSLLQERTPEELLQPMLEHRDPAIRTQVLVVLSHHLTRTPIEAIVNKLKDRRKAVRRIVSQVLLRMNEEIPADLLLPFLDCPENIARATALELLGSRVPIARLIAAAHDAKWTMRQAAIKILGTMGEQVPLDVFLEALCDRNLRVRAVALVALGNQGERVPIQILIDALHDRRSVSKAAGEVLEMLGKRVPHALIVRALRDPLPYVRRSAIHLLQAIEYEEAFPIEVVSTMIQDDDVSVREAALLALTRVGALEPVEPFIAALNDSDRNVQQAAFLALSTLGEHAPREPLKSMLGDSAMYRFAIECLEKTHPDVLREVADEASNILLGKGAGLVLGSLIQEHVAVVIGNMRNPGPLLVNRLFALLDWPYGNVRRKAEQALHKLGREPVPPAM